MTLLFYTLGFMVIGLTLFAFVRKPVLLQTMPLALNGMVTRLTSRRAKHVYRGFFYLFRALAKLALLFIDGVLVFLGSSRHKSKVLNNGSIWERDVTGVWYSFGAEEDSTRPPQF